MEEGIEKGERREWHRRERKGGREKREGNERGIQDKMHNHKNETKVHTTLRE